MKRVLTALAAPRPTSRHWHRSVRTRGRSPSRHVRTTRRRPGNSQRGCPGPMPSPLTRGPATRLHPSGPCRRGAQLCAAEALPALRAAASPHLAWGTVGLRAELQWEIRDCAAGGSAQGGRDPHPSPPVSSLSRPLLQPRGSPRPRVGCGGVGKPCASWFPFVLRAACPFRFRRLKSKSCEIIRPHIPPSLPLSLPLSLSPAVMHTGDPSFR